MIPQPDEGHEDEEPDLRIAGLSLWARSRQFPNHHDFWDGNWLNVRALAEAPGARVEVIGPLLRIDELASFAEQLEIVGREVAGEAELSCIEPNLGLKLSCNSLGHVEVKVVLTPNQLDQRHMFTFRIDQTYLSPMLTSCRRILDRFPLRAPPSTT
jgi:hypothetical protein